MAEFQRGGYFCLIEGAVEERQEAGEAGEDADLMARRPVWLPPTPGLQLQQGLRGANATISRFTGVPETILGPLSDTCSD